MAIHRPSIFFEKRRFIRKRLFLFDKENPMTLFFTYEEVQNTPKDLLQSKPFRVLSKTPDGQHALHPIYQIERKQPKTILRRGDYYLPPHSQRIEWDFLPAEIDRFLKLGRKITGYKCSEEEVQDKRNTPYQILINVDAAKWRTFFDEASLRSWAKAYAIELPEKVTLGEFELQLPQNEEEMLPLEMISRCKGARGAGEHTYRCHCKAWHGGWCQFIGHHRGAPCP
jgi:hypothetical protein